MVALVMPLSYGPPAPPKYDKKTIIVECPPNQFIPYETQYCPQAGAL
jgi:hypothetical protein